MENEAEKTDKPLASPAEGRVMPAPIEGQCVCCAGKEHVGKYGDTDIDVCEDCYRNGNLLKWLSANKGAEA